MRAEFLAFGPDSISGARGVVQPPLSDARHLSCGSRFHYTTSVLVLPPRWCTVSAWASCTGRDSGCSSDWAWGWQSRACLLATPRWKRVPNAVTSWMLPRTTRAGFFAGMPSSGPATTTGSTARSTVPTGSRRSRAPRASWSVTVEGKRRPRSPDASGTRTAERWGFVWAGSTEATRTAVACPPADRTATAPATKSVCVPGPCARFRPPDASRQAAEPTRVAPPGSAGSRPSSSAATAKESPLRAAPRTTNVELGPTARRTPAAVRVNRGDPTQPCVFRPGTGGPVNRTAAATAVDPQPAIGISPHRGEAACRSGCPGP